MRVTWDAVTERQYSSGVAQGMLYLDDGSGVPWNGLVSISRDADPDPESFYFDGIRYFNRAISSSLSGKISAFTYPDELEPYIGVSGVSTAQKRKSCGVSYRTNTELHIIYNVLLAPSDRAYETMAEQINPLLLEWNFTTQPVKIPGGKPSAHVVILVDESDPDAISELETVLYGIDDIPGPDPDDPTDDIIGANPALPAITDIIEIFESHATLRITDNGDGTWTAEGPDSIITITDEDEFQIDWPSAILTSDTTYKISSL